VPPGAGSTLYLSTAALVLVVSFLDASHSMAFRDALTSLPSRRSMDRALTRLGGTYAIAMVDVDHFKRFNDRYGHAIGDDVLRMVGRHLARTPGGGRAFRYGGEEFAVVFPGRTADAVLPHVERVRKAVAETAFTVRAKPRKSAKGKSAAPRATKTVRVTVSIGVAARSDRHPKPEDVVKAADKALYRAKKAGRNRVKR
jgi:diguanylate cyclase (GGDEF)-like protein